MKRNTDVSRIRSAEIQDSAGTGPRPSTCAAAVERATLLLAQSMQESDIPIARLSEALARMARTLGDLGTPLFGGGDQARAGTDVRAFRDALARDISVCIESLQFHDRLMQQLAQSREILTSLGANRLLAQVPETPAIDGRGGGSIELFS